VVDRSSAPGVGTTIVECPHEIVGAYARHGGRLGVTKAALQLTGVETMKKQSLVGHTSVSRDALDAAWIDDCETDRHHQTADQRPIDH